MTKLIVAAAVAALSLTACSSASPHNATPTSTAPLVQRFADQARNWRQYATGNGPGLDGFTDADLLTLGRSACASYRKTGSDDPWVYAHAAYLHLDKHGSIPAPTNLDGPYFEVNQLYAIVDAAHALICPKPKR